MDITVDTNLSSLYQYYHNMKYFGSYSTFEIDDFLPFEREVYLGMLEKSIKEKNQ